MSHGDHKTEKICYFRHRKSTLMQFVLFHWEYTVMFANPSGAVKQETISFDCIYLMGEMKGRLIKRAMNE